jgi:hypothetical protein
MEKYQNPCSKALAFISLIFLLSVLACKQKPAADPETVSFDEDFKSVFYSDSGGISGADGLFSIPLPDGSSAFLLGDCFLGKVEDGTRDINTPMLRNAFNLVDKEKKGTKAIIRGTIDTPLTFMEPVNEAGDSTYRWYWPGHGFVRDDTIYIFALSLYNVPLPPPSPEPDTAIDEKEKMYQAIFTFDISHIDLLSFTYPEFRHLETHKVEINYPVSRIDFGNCVLVNDGYVYVYGTRNLPDFSKIHVARVPLSSRFLYRDWEYFTGTTWDKEIEKSEPLDIDISVSEQFSIFRYKNKYILLTQERAGADIFTYVSDFPDKGFHNRKFIYHTPESEADTNKYVFTYNALAHGQYVEGDRLLVSYCVNSLNIKDIFDEVENYRARFLRVPMKQILKEPTK